MSLDECAPEVPVEFQRIIGKALRKDREERYQTIKDLLINLKSFKEELSFARKLERSGPPRESVGNTITPASTAAATDPARVSYHDRRSAHSATGNTKQTRNDTGCHRACGTGDRQRCALAAQRVNPCSFYFCSFYSTKPIRTRGELLDNRAEVSRWETLPGSIPTQRRHQF